MKLKKFITLVITAALALSSLPVYAEDTEPVKYENELYHIGYDIPADSYFLIPKDPTKPSYVGIYSNNGNPASALNKYYILKEGTENDYIYPRYFENLEGFREKALKAYENVGKCLYAQYFEHVNCIDISKDKNNSNPSYNFLCLENCYAVSLKYADKLEWDPNNDGFMPVSTFFKKNESYSIQPPDTKRVGKFKTYSYNESTGNIERIHSAYAYNPLYLQYTNYRENENPPTSSIITITKSTDIIYKSDAYVCDLNKNVIYKDQDLTYSDNLVEKYNFNDITPAYKNSVMQQVLNSDTYYSSVDLFKNITSSAKTDVDKEYARYMREIAIIGNYNIYGKMLKERSLKSASSFKDLDYLLRQLAYNRNITLGTSSEYSPNYEPPKYFRSLQ